MAALGIDPLLIIVYIINFGLVLFLLQRLAYKPVMETLEKRRHQIDEGLSAAAEAQKHADAQRAEFERELAKARESSQAEAKKVAEATEKMRQDILVAAEKEAAEIRAQARADAEAEKQRIASDLQKQAAELAVRMTQKIVGEAIDEKAQHKLVDQFLTNLGDA